MKTKSVLFVFMAFALILSACGASAPEATATPANTATSTATVAPTFTPTVTLTPTRTPKPTATLTPTSTPDIAATQKYESLQAQVEQLASDGVIPSAQGTYYALDDFSKSFAKIRYYTWVTYPDIIPSNFVIQARVKIAVPHKLLIT